MNFSEFWQNILAAIAAFGGISVIVGGLAAYIGNILANRMAERQKADYARALEQLKHQFNADLETLKDQLQRAALEHETFLQRKEREYDTLLQRLSREHEIRFVKLHEQRAAVMSKLYALLYKMWPEIEMFRIKLQLAFEENDKNIEAVETLVDPLFERVEQIRELAIDNKLLFGTQLSFYVDGLLSAYSDYLLTYGLYKIDPEKYQEKLLSLVENMDEGRKQFSDLLKSIEDEFKAILGTEDKSRDAAAKELMYEEI